MKFSIVVILFVLVLPLNSCKDNQDCYVCTGFDDGTTSLDDLGTICVGGDDGAGGTYTLEEVQAAVGAYELFGGTCTMQ